MANRPLKNQNSLNLFLNNYFNAILAGVLILFFVIADVLIIIPKFTATQDTIKTKIAEEQNFYAASQRKLASLQAIGSIYSKISPADLQKFNGALPDAYPQAKLFGELEETIQAGGWLLGSVTISPENTDSSASAAPNATSTLGLINDPNLHAVNLEINVSAIDYAGFKTLLRLLENNLRLLDITSVKFSPNTNSADLNLTTYYYQLPQ
jgi:hypothetical protein